MLSSGVHRSSQLGWPPEGREAVPLQEAEAIHSSQVPPELQSAPVEELMDYVVDHIVQWSQHAGW